MHPIFEKGGDMKEAIIKVLIGLVVFLGTGAFFAIVSERKRK